MNNVARRARRPQTGGLEGGATNLSQREQYPDMLRNDLYQLTSEYTGVRARTVVAIKKEAITNSGLLRTPTGKRPKSVGTRRRLVQYDFFVLSALRSCVHGFFRRNETPTVTKIREALIEALKDDEVAVERSPSTVYRLLHDIGFELQKRSRNSLLIEKDDILVWRAKYLRSILKFRAEGKAIYYLDETWVNAGHTVNKIWFDTTVRSARDAGNRGLSTGLKNPSGKGSRLIVTHVGGDQGFVEGCLDIFHGVKSGDYHDEMDGNRFEHWFDLFLTKVEPGSVIVMDNASCVPTKSSTKSVIQEWLSSKGIDWDKDMLKVELISLVSQVRRKFLSYRVDTRAETVGCTVLRLPPYHCELNPIELIWGQVKNEVARSNSSFKLKDVKVLLEQAIKNITKDNWTAAIQHVKKMEKQFWENDSLSDREVAPIIIEINAGDDSDDSYEDESCDEVVSGSGQPHIPATRRGGFGSLREAFSESKAACLCGLTPDIWYATLPLRERLQQHDEAASEAYVKPSLKARRPVCVGRLPTSGMQPCLSKNGCSNTTRRLRKPT
ncbi:uncharacterized protein ISCGN_005379 [Ixodes scapularis]